MLPIADIVFAAFALLVVLLYAKRGAVKSIYGVATVVVAGVAAYFFGETVGTTLFSPFLGGVEDRVYESLMSMLPSTNGQFNMEALFDQLPQGFSVLLARSGLTATALEEAYGTMTAATAEEVRSLSVTIAAPIIAYISRTLGNILVFSLVSLVMHLLRRVISPILRLPLIKQADKLLGALLGVVAAAIYVWILCLLASLLLECGVLNEAGAVANALAQSQVFRFAASL